MQIVYLKDLKQQLPSLKDLLAMDLTHLQKRLAQFQMKLPAPVVTVPQASGMQVTQPKETSELDGEEYEFVTNNPADDDFSDMPELEDIGTLNPLPSMPKAAPLDDDLLTPAMKKMQERLQEFFKPLSTPSKVLALDYLEILPIQFTKFKRPTVLDKVTEKTPTLYLYDDKNDAGMPELENVSRAAP